MYAAHDKHLLTLAGSMVLCSCTMHHSKKNTALEYVIHTVILNQSQLITDSQSFIIIYLYNCSTSID